MALIQKWAAHQHCLTAINLPIKLQQYEIGTHILCYDDVEGFLLMQCLSKVQNKRHVDGTVAFQDHMVESMSVLSGTFPAPQWFTLR